MKRILTTLLMPALLLAAPISPAQEPASPATAATPAPADSIVPLYPKRALKGLKKQGDEDLCPYGLLATDRAVLVLSSLGAYHGGTYQDLVLSSSKDGSSWNKLSIAIPKFTPRSGTTNVAAVFDSFTKQVVLLAHVAPSILGTQQTSKFDKKGTAASGPRFYVAFGKGGKFSKPRDITKQFAGRKGAPPFKIEGHGLHFQGICLTKGEHRGRLLFIACYEDKAVCSVYSDDHGRSWKTGESVTLPRLSPNSLGDGLTLCEAEDGTVVSYTGGLRTGGTWLSSKDGGASWEEKKGLPNQPRTDPGHWPNSFIVLNTKDGQGTGSRLLAISLVGNHDKQFHVALSYDWGRTWPHEKTIHCATLNAASNINIQRIAPGTLGVITNAEGGFAPTNCVDAAGFTTFTISWLTDGKDDGIDEEEATAGKDEK